MTTLQYDCYQINNKMAMLCGTLKHERVLALLGPHQDAEGRQRLLVFTLHHHVELKINAH